MGGRVTARPPARRRPSTIAEIQALPDPVRRVRAADRAIEAHRRSQAGLADLRAQAIAELAELATQADVAEALGITQPAVAKAVARARTLSNNNRKAPK